MTDMQVRYATLLEQERANKAKEAISQQEVDIKQEMLPYEKTLKQYQTAGEITKSMKNVGDWERNVVGSATDIVKLIAGFLS